MSDLSSYNFLTAAHYISEPKKAVMKGNGKMSKKTSNNMICAATAMVAGGIAFACGAESVLQRVHQRVHRRG